MAPIQKIAPEDAVPLIYSLLREHFGHLNWWPGETQDEIVIGAILTQNTAWTNVEKAIDNLKREKVLDLPSMKEMPLTELEKLVRPSGFFRQKARRLKRIADEFCARRGGGTKTYLSSDRDPGTVRKELLGIKGVGNETADSIMLYAGAFLVFVIDAYTFRICRRTGLYRGKKDYAELQRLFTDNLPADVDLYRDYHAQLVELGKNFCGKRSPRCGECPILSVCSREGI